MISTLQSFAGLLLVVGLGLLIGAGLAALPYRLLRFRLPHMEPAGRARLLLAVLLLPPFTALLATVSLAAPGAALGPDALAHCAAHGHAGHAACDWHFPQLQLPAWLAAAIWLLTLAAMGWIGARARRVMAVAARLRTLRHLARPAAHADYRVLPVATPLAFAAGFMRGQVYISEGLERALSPARMRIVLAHEQAHLRRHDVPMSLVVSALSRLHWPPLGNALRRAWRLAAEQRCDELAAEQSRDRVGVADCILRMARLQQSTSKGAPMLACHMVDSDVTARITALLAPPVDRHPSLILVIASAQLLAAGSLLVVGSALHRWAEIYLPLIG